MPHAVVVGAPNPFVWHSGYFHPSYRTGCLRAARSLSNQSTTESTIDAIRQELSVRFEDDALSRSSSSLSSSSASSSCSGPDGSPDSHVSDSSPSSSASVTSISAKNLTKRRMYLHLKNASSQKRKSKEILHSPSAVYCHEWLSADQKPASGLEAEECDVPADGGGELTDDRMTSSAGTKKINWTQVWHNLLGRVSGRTQNNGRNNKASKMGRNDVERVEISIDHSAVNGRSKLPSISETGAAAEAAGDSADSTAVAPHSARPMSISPPIHDDAGGRSIIPRTFRPFTFLHVDASIISTSLDDACDRCADVSGDGGVISPPNQQV